jgi:hypothetical protein
MHNIRYVFRKPDTDLTQNTVTNYFPRNFIKYSQYQNLFQMTVINMKRSQHFMSCPPTYAYNSQMVSSFHVLKTSCIKISHVLNM